MLPKLWREGSVRNGTILSGLLGGVDAAAVPAKTGSLAIMRRHSFAWRCVHELAYTVIDNGSEHSSPARDGFEVPMGFETPPLERSKGPRSNEPPDRLSQYAVA